MQLPAIPTDNLYKFVALSGLALCAFSVTYPAGKVLELRYASIDIQAQIKKLTIDVNGLTSEIDLLKGKAPDQQKPEEVVALSRNLLAIEHKKVDVEAAMEKLDVNRAWAWAYFLFAAGSGFLGTWATTQGFRVWYERVQLPQDQELLAPPSEA